MSPFIGENVISENINDLVKVKEPEIKLAFKAGVPYFYGRMIAFS